VLASCAWHPRTGAQAQVVLQTKRSGYQKKLYERLQEHLRQVPELAQE